LWNPEGENTYFVSFSCNIDCLRHRQWNVNESQNGSMGKLLKSKNITLAL
jgi:hypothetical protein